MFSGSRSASSFSCCGRDRSRPKSASKSSNRRVSIYNNQNWIKEIASQHTLSGKSVTATMAFFNALYGRRLHRPSKILFIDESISCAVLQPAS